jgi:surfactin synthase thioesterase subunit
VAAPRASGGLRAPDAGAPTLRLIAFPYAGASSACYHQLGEALPARIDLTTHELPGHGTRIREPLEKRLPPLVDDALERLGATLRGSYAFYGHSFGAWLARDLILRLVELGRPLPVYLFVSGRRAPLSVATGPLLHRLPAAALRARLREWGGIPEAVLEDDELMALFERLLRADFEALETRHYEASAPLDLPIHLMLGLDDDIDSQQARDWQRETLRPLSLSYFSGGHFFIREHMAKLGRDIGERLLSLMSHAASAPVIGSTAAPGG